MAPYEIKNLDKLLKNVLNGAEIASVSVTNLTSAGENYGSAIFSVEILAKDDENEREIHAVAKMIPQNEFIQRLFNSRKTFRNEIGFYQKIAPCLREFQKEKGLNEVINSWPDYYGSRLNLNSSNNEVDENGVLLIKNIKDEGFTIFDRRIGFDLEQSKLVLDKMAELHATFLAFKTQKPEMFQRDLGEFFHDFVMFEGDLNSAAKICNSVVELLEEDEFCREYLSKIRETMLRNCKIASKKNFKEFQKSPFTSLVHSDMWTNNIMMKTVDGKAVDLKFVDYQIYELSSLTRDVVFFLFSSVQLQVIQKHCDNLLVYYFNSFVSILKKLKCDTSIFKYEDFLEEMGSMMKKVEFFHIMLMLRPIFALDKDVKEVDDLKMGDFVENRMELAEGCKPKAFYIVRELIRRNWI